MLDSTNTNPSSSQVLEETPKITNLAASYSSSSGSGSSGSSSSNVFASLFASSTTSSATLQPQTTGFPTQLFQAIAHPDPASSSSSEPVALCLALNQGSSIFGKPGQERRQYPPAPQPALSATALLQKAAQMGAASNASLLRGLGIVSSTSSPNVSEEWNHQQKLEPDAGSLAASGLGLGLGCDSGSGLKELMLGMGTPSVFGPKHTTLDLLGLGMAASGGSTGRLSALMNGGLDVTAAQPFDGREYGSQEMRRCM